MEQNIFLIMTHIPLATSWHDTRHTKSCCSAGFIPPCSALDARSDHCHTTWHAISITTWHPKWHYYMACLLTHYMTRFMTYYMTHLQRDTLTNTLKREAVNAILNTWRKTASTCFSAFDESEGVTLLPSVFNSHLKLP